MNKVTRVLIADDHLAERQGIARVLSSAEDIEVIGQVGEIDLVVDEIRRTRPDAVLMDLKWNEDEEAGIKATTQIKQLLPGIRVIAISVYDHLIPEALKAGADAALAKGFSRGELSLSPALKLAGGRKRRPQNSLSLTGEASLRVTPSLLFSQGIRVEGGDWHPSWLLVRPWKENLWGATSYAYMRWQSHGFYLLMGREALKWGPSPRVSLLLGNNSPFFDQLRLGFKVGRLRFTSFSTLLDDLGLEAFDAGLDEFLDGVVEVVSEVHRLHDFLELKLVEDLVFAFAHGLLAEVARGPLAPLAVVELGLEVEDDNDFEFDVDKVKKGFGI